MTSKLYERTRELLRSTAVPGTEIAKALGCSTKTLYLMRENKHVPNVELCEAVYNLLSNAPLEVK